MARDQVLNDRRPSAIGYELELGAGEVLKIGPGNLVDAAAADHSRRGLTRIGLEPSDQPFQIFAGKSFLATIQKDVVPSSAIGSK
jgi:hypothetical protein